MANLSRNKNDERLAGFLQRIFDRIPVGLYRTTPEGRIIHANLALARMLGYESVEDLKSRDLEIEGYEPSYPRKAFKERIEREGAIHGLDARWCRTDGTFIDVMEYAEAVKIGRASCRERV